MAFAIFTIFLGGSELRIFLEGHRPLTQASALPVFLFYEMTSDLYTQLYTDLCLCFVDLWHHLVLLHGEEGETVERTSEDLLVLGRYRLHISVCIVTSTETE